MKLLNYLIDLNKIRSRIIKNICRQKFNKIEQASKQSFDEFYRAFIKYFVFRKDNEKILLQEMKRKSVQRFEKCFFFCSRILSRCQSRQND